MWLAAIAALPLLPSTAGHAKPGSLQLQPAEKVSNAPNFLLPTAPQFNSESPLHDGMIAQEEFAPNAHVGVGLAPMLGRNIHSVRIEQEPVATRNPGVTFVLKFAR